ncbi:hypothetical protein ACFSTA_19250 [Ornithinibacillus salinisoli]|uniref:Moybdenum cofactor oxidoreductase dimerisation domain-containing protein n=1 Tax=Ornithinibacillus salinisoli TaxID=1848459 RepID=A0ABW4W6X5_9BACI
MNVNSTIQNPLHMDVLNEGKQEISGIAWTGEGIIKKVEISFDNGSTWLPCQLMTTPHKYRWVKWRYEWSQVKKGEYTILSRATDTKGRVQPFEPMWNRKGYGYNARSC